MLKTTPMQHSTVICRSRGSALAEAGPALFMLVIMFFFPLLNMISIGLAYGCAAYLNHLQLREVVFSRRSECEGTNAPVPVRVLHEWQRMGIGKFLAVAGQPRTVVSYRRVSRDYNDNDNWEVMVSTKLDVRPFISVPFFRNVPYLGAPARLIISSNRLLENSSNYLR